MIKNLVMDGFPRLGGVVGEQGGDAFAFRLFIKLCHWVPKVPFFSKNGQQVKVERFHFYLKNRKIKR